MQISNSFYSIAGFVFISVFSALKLPAQDTLILIDRQSRVVDFHALNDSMVVYAQPGKQRLREIERDKLYSINSPGKEPHIVYVQDTLEGNWYTAEQMGDYIRGQQDAFRGYEKMATQKGSSSFIWGFVGSTAGVLYGPLLLIGYTWIRGYPLPKFTKENGYDIAYVNNSFYKEGFGTAAKRMSNRRNIIGASTGFVLGVITFTIMLR
jgi:hypothetical protein